MLPPLGWRFAPFDEELIKDYLVKRVRGDALPCDIIHDSEHKKDEDAAAAKMPLKRSSSSTVAADQRLSLSLPEPALDMPIPVLFSSPSEDILDLEIIFEELDDLAESHTYTDDVDSELAAFFADLPPMTEDWNQLVGKWVCFLAGVIAVEMPG
uniref:Uncharacterized protein n=1 Tax=Fagus sylvatica TaxID=28930 RepID=A0A2N9G081_FAGSY